jgi:hypothetical protein
MAQGADLWAGKLWTISLVTFLYLQGNTDD